MSSLEAVKRTATAMCVSMVEGIMAYVHHNAALEAQEVQEVVQAMREVLEGYTVQKDVKLGGPARQETAISNARVEGSMDADDVVDDDAEDSMPFASNRMAVEDSDVASVVTTSAQSVVRAPRIPRPDQYGGVEEYKEEPYADVHATEGGTRESEGEENDDGVSHVFAPALPRPSQSKAKATVQPLDDFDGYV